MITAESSCICLLVLMQLNKRKELKCKNKFRQFLPNFAISKKNRVDFACAGLLIKIYAKTKLFKVHKVCC